jgi:CheY-like chemotaxis protein
LGLATIYGFAQQSGGHVTIESEVDTGTTVALYLPRNASDASAPRLEARDEEETPTAAGITVLVVEDKQGVRDLTVRRLDALGYTALMAEDGPAAIAVLGTGTTVDVVLSDVVMAGGMSGVDLARWLKERRPDVRVLLSSGFADIVQDEAAADLDLKLLRKALQAGRPRARNARGSGGLTRQKDRGHPVVFPRGALDSFSGCCLQPDARHPPTWGEEGLWNAAPGLARGDARLSDR